ncbi:MAG: TraB/VirB10 family protein [Alphaproteobacteria bacterium]|nr:TraB/VirB10 family protein [Alphaproteobacteria bacterium]
MKHSVKKEQIKKFGYIGGGIALFFVAMVFFQGSAESTTQLGRYYKKEIKNGVDGLSDKDLWIEKSTNEIEDIRKDNKKLQDQNDRLQKQLDSVQKLVIGLGRHLRAFDDQQEYEEDKADTIPSQSVPEYEKYKQENPYISGNSESPALELKNPIEKFRNFSEQRGIIGAEKLPTSFVQKHANNSEILKNGIKTFNFSVPKEHDLDENFIFAGTYARGVLLGSATVSAGISSSSNPKPVLLRITDTGNLPNKVKGLLKDAVVIGAASGHLSSESVEIRLERLTKIDKAKGIGIDIPIKGYVAGENGDSEIRGKVFDRAGAVARNAAVAGFLSGAAEAITTNNSSAVTFEPNSGLAQFSPKTGAKMLEMGASKGIGNAMEKYADFYIKRAEQMQPVIKIDGGRKVTIVFTESVKASTVNMKKVRRKFYAKQY